MKPRIHWNADGWCCCTGGLLGVSAWGSTIKAAYQGWWDLRVKKIYGDFFPYISKLPTLKGKQ